MIKLILWIVWLMLLLFLCMIQSKRIVLTPQFGFVGCFIPQAIFAVYFVEKWELDFSVQTMLVLFGGSLLFVLSSFFFSYCLSRIPVRSGQLQNNSGQMNKEITVESWKLIAFLIVQLVVLYFVIRFFMNNIPGSTLMQKIRNYNDTNKFGDVEDRISLPRFLSWARMISTSSCYLTGYILVHSLILKYKQHRLLLLLNIIVSLLNVALNGGRFPIIAFIIALIVQAYIIWGRVRNWQSRLHFNTILKFVILSVLIVAVFQQSATFLGRASTKDPIDYLGNYLGAQLKNLDIYVRAGDFGCDVSNWQTLIAPVNYIARKFNITGWRHTYDQPFIRFKGKNLGNVYTIFYWYLHDGGYPAIILFVIFEAFIAQVFFRKAIYTNRKDSINFNIIIYSYIFYGIVFSFYCERFYLSFFNISMVQMLVSWWLLRLFFTKVTFSNQSNRLHTKRETIRAFRESNNY